MAQRKKILAVLGILCALLALVPSAHAASNALTLSCSAGDRAKTYHKALSKYLQHNLNGSGIRGKARMRRTGAEGVSQLDVATLSPMPTVLNFFSLGSFISRLDAALSGGCQESFSFEVSFRLPDGTPLNLPPVNVTFYGEYRLSSGSSNVILNYR